MAKRKSFEDSPCPVARALDIIGDRWSLLIIRDAFDGMKRFSEFQESLGIAKNILTDRLKMLTQHHILKVVPASDGSAYQEYVLTPKGEDLFPIIVTLRQWGEERLFQQGEKHSLLVERKSGKLIQKIEIKTKDHQILNHNETVVYKVME